MVYQIPIYCAESMTVVVTTVLALISSNFTWKFVTTYEVSFWGSKYYSFAELVFGGKTFHFESKIVNSYWFLSAYLILEQLHYVRFKGKMQINLFGEYNFKYNSNFNFCFSFSAKEHARQTMETTVAVLLW